MRDVRHHEGVCAVSMVTFAVYCLLYTKRQGSDWTISLPGNAAPRRYGGVLNQYVVL